MEVWPWLVQIGQARGGFYSYSWLENLLGCDIHNADRILPEFQTLKAGDTIRLHPKAPPIPVVLVEPGRALVLHGRPNPEVDQQYEVKFTKPGNYVASSWAFVLDPLDERTTRLLVRFRMDYDPTFGNKLAFRAMLEPIHFVMQRKMLLGIKQRAEAAAKK